MRHLTKYLTRASLLGLCLAAALLTFSTSALKAEETGARKFDYASFALLPVQHQGRTKPLDTFARTYLKLFSYSSTLSSPEDGRMSAVAWLAETIFAPEQAYQRPLFKIRDPEVADGLNLPSLPPSKNNLYSFRQLTEALQANRDLLDHLSKHELILLTPSKREMLNLLQKSVVYFEISRSLSLFTPVFVINDSANAAGLGIIAGTKQNYLEAVRLQPRLINLLQERLVERARAGVDAEVSENTRELLGFANLLDVLDADRNSRLLKVIPRSSKQDTWHSPWENIAQGAGDPGTALLFSIWQELGYAYVNQNSAYWQDTSRKLLDKTLSQSDYPLDRLKLEAIYNRVGFFGWGMLLYVLSIFGIFTAFANNYFRKSAEHIKNKGEWHAKIYIGVLSLTTAGLLMQLAGIVMRMLILQRPPVGDFYESLLFVGGACVLGGLVLENIRRDWSGLLLACFSGIGLSFLGLQHLAQQESISAGSDSMQMLTAVLNTNYWLATHVVVITLGYAASIITALLAHFYLGRLAGRAYGLWNDERNIFSFPVQLIVAAALLSLFLMLLGTILGGIWADQSWGRFWGWDPKENGALLIILWLIFILHLRLTAVVKEPVFVAGAAMLGLTVALSWFGVNLLGIGLHSYGFIDSETLWGMLIFVVAEVLFIGGALAYVLIPASKTTPTNKSEPPAKPTAKTTRGRKPKPATDPVRKTRSRSTA